MFVDDHISDWIVKTKHRTDFQESQLLKSSANAEIKLLLEIKNGIYDFFTPKKCELNKIMKNCHLLNRYPADKHSVNIWISLSFQIKSEPGMTEVKQEVPSVDSAAVTTPKAEPTDCDDVKPSPMEVSQSGSTPVQSPAPTKPKSKKSNFLYLLHHV